MASFGKLSGTVVEHGKLQTLHELKRDPTGTHLFSSHLIEPIPGRLQACAALCCGWTGRQSDNQTFG